MFNEDDLMPKLPKWEDISGGQQSQAPDVTPFVSALKKRLANPMAKQSGAPNDMTSGKVVGAVDKTMSGTGGASPQSLS